MKDKSKYISRNHHKNDDGSKNRIRQNRHKKVSQLERDQALSRKKRRENRNRIVFINIENEKKSFEGYSILIISDETEHNENILLQKRTIDNGMYMLELPLISDNDDLVFDKSNVNEYLKKTYGVTADSVEFDTDHKLVIVKDIKSKDTNLKSIVIRTYNPATWFGGISFTTVKNSPYFKGEQTDIYLASTEDLGDIIISGKLLSTVLDYRIKEGKIFDYVNYNQYGGSNFRSTGSILDFYWVYNDEKTMDVLNQEEAEITDLLFGCEPIQDINKFVRYKKVFDIYNDRVNSERQNYSNFFDFMNGIDDIQRDFNQKSSNYFSRIRRDESTKK